MNIFALDQDPQLSAEMHNDKHVVKMILEYAQILSTTHRLLDGDKDILYKATHKNHPSTVWARQSTANYKWLHKLWVCLSNEYTHRYDKTHLSYTKLKDILNTPPSNLQEGPLTSVSQAMPEEYKNSLDHIKAYRDYYIGEKQALAKWTKRDVPLWYLFK
jgi:hypothetical protein